MVFGLSALNRVPVYNFRRVCPKHGKVTRLLSLNMVCPRQGLKIEGDVLLRVAIFVLFLS